ncbi:MAG: glucuronate isomerase [Odoribacteraceae bacterium]|jgi:glucuronate isomerase|nr:glucuronate isomerase [Odoribacteraceae bacterium]
MKDFNDENFLLQTKTAERLYHEHAAGMPVIDYHCHLDPARVANDHSFDNLARAWLEGDHYKWRAMRANGIDERFCTGDATDREKFDKWAETVPYTMRNPLYHWTHLELKTAFGITTLLGPSTAGEIYDTCSAMLRENPDYSCRGLMLKYRVEVACTTDDPVDSLEHHARCREEGFKVKLLPTWRPDKAMAVESPASFRAYVERLSEVSGVTISHHDDLVAALRVRHDHFAAAGCRLSDHGLEEFHAKKYTARDTRDIFNKVYGGTALDRREIARFKSAMLVELAAMDHEKGWVQQFHYGALRDNNTRVFRLLGPDAGCDSIGEFHTARALSRFLDALDADGKLAKTIIYNLNPSANEMVATMVGNFQQGPTPGKMQFGAGWWFLDQRDGIERQLNALSSLGLLGRFVGMLTDSRSFLSYPRHEYFRRVLCNLLGNDVERGLLPASELPFIGKMVEDICYNNAKSYFNF